MAVFTSTMTATHGSGNFNQLTRTGKSFLLNSVFLWCLVNGKRVKAAAPRVLRQQASGLNEQMQFFCGSKHRDARFLRVTFLRYPRGI